MLKAWYNPELKKCYYDPEAKKILTTGAPCQWCPEPSAAPDMVKVVPDGILVCAGVGECGNGADSRYKVLGQGIGWCGEAMLSRGRFTWNPTSGLWTPIDDDGQGSYCYWAEVIYDDFGSYAKYNLDDCQGGIDYIVNLVSRCVQLVRGGNTWYIDIMLRGPKGSPDLWDHVETIFRHYDSGGPFEEWCIPYGEWDNDYTCPTDGVGNGTVKIIEV